MALVLLLVAFWGVAVEGHFSANPRDAEPLMRTFSNSNGVMVSFEHPVYSNGKFTPFHSWNMTNDKYRAVNITYIVRVEFSNGDFKENRIRRHFKRFWLPGAIWVERSTRDQNIYNRDLKHVKTRNHSHVDIWVVPECFLRHHGMSRIHRVAKSMKMSVHHIRWLAKINYQESEQYRLPELMQIGRSLVQDVPGIRCSWIHPRTDSSFSLMIRFFAKEIPQKSFYSNKKGYMNWDFLNNEYQVQAIHFFRGWSRALVDFAGGINCREHMRSIGQRYQSLPSVNFVYLDINNECRFTYQIAVAFNPRSIKPGDIFFYNEWDYLNKFYGAVQVKRHLAAELKAIIEFEPGMYNHQQMKAIRNEYVKLPGIRFGWVMGKTAVQVSTIILNFDKRFARRQPLKKYNYWNSLNRRYLANITVIEEEYARAHIRFPAGAYSDLQLKNILSKYKHLPGIESVRMDTQTYGNTKDFKASMMSNDNNTSYALEELLPKGRSLESWIQLSQGDSNLLATKVTFRGLGQDQDHYQYISKMPAYEHEMTASSQCINVN